MASQYETEIKDCIQYIRIMYKERKETTHGEIGERTYMNIYKPNISTTYVKLITRSKVHEQCI